MQRKTLPVQGIKTAGLGAGEFEGWASTFGNVDAHGDRVMPGAFGKSLQSGRVIPLLWLHKSDDPRAIVGEVVDAAEVDEGLRIRGRFDLDTDTGAAAYRAVKSRRVDALSIGYRVNVATKADDGATELRDLDLIEISVVPRGANDRALITAAKSAAAGVPTGPLRSALARAAAAAVLTPSTTPTSKEPTTMYEHRAATFTKRRDDAALRAKSIIDAADAEGRDLTTDEAAEVTAATEAIKSADAAIGQAKDDQAVYTAAADFAAAIGTPVRATSATGGPAAVDGGHIALTGKHAKALAANIVAALPRDPMSAKSLIPAGQVTTSTIVLPDVTPEGRAAVSVLDVLPMRIVTPHYRSLVQRTRDLAAAAVAVGDLKPESDIGIEAIDARLRVVAHLTAGVDKYILSDSGVVRQFIEEEMIYGLRRAVETQILTGDGEGENMTGVLNTSGIQLQEFATDALTSVRKALTRLDVQGYRPGLVVLDAGTWEGIELLTATSGATDRAIPVDPVARRLFGTPVVLSEQLGAGVGLVIGDGAVVVDHDGIVETLWSDAAGDLFQRNALACRVEGRFNVSVAQPLAVVKVETAEPAGA